MKTYYILFLHTPGLRSIKKNSQENVDEDKFAKTNGCEKKFVYSGYM